MSEAVHEYRAGDQDIDEQVATFRLFGRLMKWGSLAVGALVLTLVLWFCVDAGFFSGLLTGLVVVALGIWFLRSRPASAH